MEALEKQYADVLAPLKENLAPKKLSFKYVQKLTKRNVIAYTVPDEVSIMFLLFFSLNFVKGRFVLLRSLSICWCSWAFY